MPITHYAVSITLAEVGPTMSPKFLLQTLLVVALPVSPVFAGVRDGVEAARAFKDAQAATLLQDYVDFLSLPNDTNDRQGLEANAEFIRDRLTERGVDSEIWTLEGADPVVYGELQVAGAERTLGIYAQATTEADRHAADRLGDRFLPRRDQDRGRGLL